MNKYPSNVAMYEEVAKKLGLATEYVQSTPHRKPLLISNNKKFFLINTGSPGFYPETKRWNAHFTGSKLLTQEILKKFKYNVIKTDEVRVAQFPNHRSLSSFLNENEYTYPCLIKPDRGQDGANIAIAEDSDQLVKISRIHFLKKQDFLIQPIVVQKEYRILVVNNEVVLMHSKHNQSVIGDGKSSIKKLLASVSENKKNTVFIAWQHKKLGTKPSTILKKGERFEYHLTKIPTRVFYETKNFPPATKKWAIKLAETISSPVVGIDVFIPESFTNTSQYTIIELNSNPAVYYLAKRCGDTMTGYKIIEKVIRDYFKL